MCDQSRQSWKGGDPVKNAMERREAVLERLRAAQAPVSAAALARRLGVIVAE